MSKPKIINVKTQLEWTNRFLTCLLEWNGKPNSVVLPPLFETEARQIRFINEAILRKHAAKKTRKDIYINK